ncbi:putative oxidoreductase, partial [Salmonella enterica subsp. enterica serovar Heidelberg str. RI-11-014316]
QVRDRWREQGGPGSGIWYDLAPHLLDQAIQLFGPAGQHDGGFSATASGRAIYRLFPRDFIPTPTRRVILSRYDAGRGGIRAIHRSWFAR